MDNKKTYGFCKLSQDSYDTLMAKPTLTEKIPTKIGYNYAASNFVMSKIAQRTQDCGFIDTVKLLTCPTREEALNYMNTQFAHKNLAVGNLDIFPNAEGGFYFLNQLIAPLRNSLLLSEDIYPLKRCVVDLTLVIPQKEPHGVALCIDADKKNKKLNLIMLEQHAYHKGEKRYIHKLDYGEEIKSILEYYATKGCFNTIGYEVQTFQNEKPICRKRRVCGIVSSEMCRRLLKAKDPMELAKSGRIKLSAIQVLGIHQKNVRNYQKECILQQVRETGGNAGH